MLARPRFLSWMYGVQSQRVAIGQRREGALFNPSFDGLNLPYAPPSDRRVTPAGPVLKVGRVPQTAESTSGGLMSDASLIH